MKRVTILSLCFVMGLASAASAQEAAVPTPLHPGTTLDLDDKTAGDLIVAGKAKYDPDAELKSTAKKHEAAIDERAKAAAVSPMEQMAKAMATAMAAEFAKALKPAEPAKPAAA